MDYPRPVVYGGLLLSVLVGILILGSAEYEVSNQRLHSVPISETASATHSLIGQSTMPSNPPFVGVTIHTFYVPTSPFHWDWYKNSSTYWDFSNTKPTRGFYDQTKGMTIQRAHYQQLRQAKVDYALFSWFGGINDPTTDAAINQVLDSYWKVFTALNKQTKAAPVYLAVLMESSSDYQTRIDWLASNIYGKYPAYVLKYNGQPVLAIGSDASPSAALEYARSKGFYVVDGSNAESDGEAFVGITMKADDPHRITPQFAGVSPSTDGTGKEMSYEAESMTKGCGTRTSDNGASNRAAVRSSGVNCDVVTTTTHSISTTAQYLTEWYGIFRIKTPNTAAIGGNAFVTENCTYGTNVYSQPIGPGSFSGNNKYTHIVVKFTHLDPSCSVTLRVSATGGSIIVDRIWVSMIQFRKPSIAEYDSQWEPIANLPLGNRPTFISIASLNAWEEGTAIESSSYFGTQFLDRTAYWSGKIKQ